MLSQVLAKNDKAQRFRQTIIYKQTLSMTICHMVTSTLASVPPLYDLSLLSAEEMSLSGEKLKIKLFGERQDT